MNRVEGKEKVRVVGGREERCAACSLMARYGRRTPADIIVFSIGCLRIQKSSAHALMAGLMTVPDVALLTALHAVKFVFVQPEHVPLYPSKIPSRPMT
jgi:hypothetical protein